jgi:hypothetical protein
MPVLCRFAAEIPEALAVAMAAHVLPLAARVFAPDVMPDAASSGEAAERRALLQVRLPPLPAPVAAIAAQSSPCGHCLPCSLPSSIAVLLPLCCLLRCPTACRRM